MSNPKSKAEWQEAVNAADFCIKLDACCQYGLIQRIPVDENGKQNKDWHYRDSGVNVERCMKILEQGSKIGIYPNSEGVEGSDLKPISSGGNSV